MTHALLLTDVVDSTALAERLGDAAMAELWTRHDRVARDLLVPHGGREIDKTDGFLLLFEAAADAASYALAYHRALAPLGLKARAGLHVGPVILRENLSADIARGAKPLEVEGIAKPTAARVMGLALPGQTLLTAEAAETLPPLSNGPVLLAHGHWMLKGLLAPVPLFEVGVPGVAPMTPPPDAPKAWRVVWKNDAWIPVRAVKHSLPAERDAFVGRVADLLDLARRLDDGARLVTVLGMGGAGKTRLVTHYGWTWLGSWPGGVWFCDLSEARGVDGIAYAVARALDVPLGKDDPIVQLGHAIAGRGKCLVVLDNFEQVARDAPETLGKWLDRASDAQFVVTTREVLGLPGELSLALAPLVGDEAVELFVARAVAAKRDFTLSEADRPHVRALVKLLDGLPLAIELAAARVRVMAPQALLLRMSERFKLLTSAGGRHTRQATLRATLDWSWDLLSADERSALAQVSVFEGGFTLAAAEAVLTLQALWPTDAVQALVDKSLVRPVSAERFDLLVSIQEYAAERLDVSGTRADAEARHGQYYAAYGTDEAIEALDKHGGVERRRALSFELDNLVSASRRAVARADGEVAAATLQAASTVLFLRGPFVLAAQLATAGLGVLAFSPRTRGIVARVLGAAQERLGRMDEAKAHYDAALAAAREMENRRFEGILLGLLGGVRCSLGQMDEAQAHYDAALTLAREVGDRSSEGGLLCNLGIVHAQQGRMDEARAHYDAALGVDRDVGNRRFEGIVLGNLANLHRDQGRMHEARVLYDAAVAVAREVGDRRSEGSLLGNLGNLHFTQGRMDEARAHYDAAVAVAREVGDRRNEGIGLGNLGNLHRDQGRMVGAQALYDTALAVHREVGDRNFEGIALGNLGGLHRAQGRMDEAQAHFDAALAVARKVGNRGLEGAVLGELGNSHAEQRRINEALACFDAGEILLRAVGDQTELAKLLCGRARLEWLEGRPEAARTILHEVEGLATAIGAGTESEISRELKKTRAALEAT